MPGQPPNPGPHKAGFVAIVGAPNAGKSSLLNRLLGQKVAIVTSKPQTTRHRLLGILTQPGAQIAFWDTPGLHDSPKALNKGMVARALAALADCDGRLWLVDGTRRGPGHQKALEAVLAQPGPPLVVCANKADLLSPGELGAALGELGAAASPDRLLAVSAKTGQGLKKLKSALVSLLPASPPLFDRDALTDQTLRSIAAEYVREAVFELTRQEVPYSAAVTVDSFAEPDPQAGQPLFRVSATVHVERDSQKGLMIGRGARRLRQIGERARLGLEGFLGHRVFLSLFVRVTPLWSEDPQALREFGYLDPKDG